MPHKDPAVRRAWWRERRREVREIVNAAKDRPCMDCDGVFPICCMQFDHVRGDKAFNIGGSVRVVKNIQVLREEIAKCEVVCANCHAIRTFTRGYYSPPLKDESPLTFIRQRRKKPKP